MSVDFAIYWDTLLRMTISPGARTNMKVNMSDKTNEIKLELGRRRALYEKIIKYDESISEKERDFYRGKASALEDLMYLLIKYDE